MLGIMDNVSIVKPLATNGKLFLVKQHDQYYALKRTKASRQLDMDHAQREVTLLKQMKHPNIVQYVADSLDDSNVVSLLMEYCPGGNLLEYTEKRKREMNPYDEPEISRMFLQMCRAVEYLHRHTPPVAHRDVKLENFLIGPSGRIVLCDFGSCSTTVTRCETKEERATQEELIERFTTPFYRAPELVDLFSGKLISEKVDIWALGCVLFALAFDAHAFQNKLATLNATYTIPQPNPYSAPFLQTFPWLFNAQPEQRPMCGDLTDYFEELLGVRKGMNAIERGCGNGARPVATQPSPKPEMPAVQASKPPATSARSSSRDIARMRLANRK